MCIVSLLERINLTTAISLLVIAFYRFYGRIY